MQENSYFTPQQQRLISQRMHVPMECAMCGGAEAYKGMYLTADKRVVLYGLCEKCQKDPFAAMRVEVAGLGTPIEQ